VDFLHTFASITVSISEILRVLTSSNCPYREMEFFVVASVKSSEKEMGF